VILCFAIVYLVWGSTYLVTSLGVHTMPPLLFGGTRFVVAGVLLLATGRLLGRGGRIDARVVKHAIATGFFLVLMSNGSNNWGMQYVASNQAALLNASAAFWIVVFGLFGARAERPALRVLTGVVLGFMGTALVVWRDGAANEPAMRFAEFVILAGCMGWAAGTIYLRNANPRLDLISFSGLQMICGGLMLLAAGVLAGEPARWTWNRAGLEAMAFLVVASNCLAYTAYAWLTRHVPAASVGTYGYVNPAVATLLGWLVLEERLTATQVVGMIVMLSGVALVTWPTRESAPESPG
jgi:drug/metabolite transporter (DMT)-like permease